MVHLNELQETYGAKGFKVLAVTNEDKGVVDAFVEAQKPAFPIVIEEGDSAESFGAGGFPSSFLIAPDGTIAWSGHPGNVPEDKIEELLSHAEVFPDLPAKFSPVKNAMEKGRFAEADKALAKLKDGGTLTEEDGAAADKLAEWLDWQRKATAARLAKATEAGDWYRVWKTYTDVAKAWKGADLAAEAEGKLAEILADKDKKAEVDAGKTLASILDKSRDMSPKKQIQQLERMTGKKYAETKAGKEAAALILALEKEIAASKR